MITISVIIPTLNAERFLPTVLASVAAQTYTPHEVFIVDGPSTDATAEIARGAPNVQYVRQTGRGMWNALNEGVALSTGQALAFVSSDDVWYPEKLQRQAEWLDAHPETIAVFCHALFEDLGEGSVLRASKPDLFGSSHPSYMTEAMVARREMFDRLGPFLENYQIASDIEWFGRMIDAGISIQMLPQVLWTKRFHAGNLSANARLGAAYTQEMLSAMREKIRRARKQAADEPTDAA